MVYLINAKLEQWKALSSLICYIHHHLTVQAGQEVTVRIKQVHVQEVLRTLHGTRSWTLSRCFQGKLRWSIGLWRQAVWVQVLSQVSSLCLSPHLYHRKVVICFPAQSLNEIMWVTYSNGAQCRARTQGMMAEL